MTHVSHPQDQSARATILKNLDALPQILVVCTGNICRSPMGEVVLRERLHEAGLNEYSVASCGVSDEESGGPIYPPAAAMLRENGYPVPVRRAHQATPAELTESGLILAMTVGHARALRPTLERLGVPLERVHLWREFDGTAPIASEGCYLPGGVLAGGQNKHKRSRGYSDYYSSEGTYDVPDPWYTRDFDATLDVVEAGAAGIARLLDPQ
ncbi:MAG: low molecular weight protein-tyrosine-phosphatase [Ancrocorticia sp.]|uniref:low molecular weight protein-tyrosine-phosphatase n=1 Tax=Ancrocorticia sp. TaxID=2593684 RepID=UPI003F8E9FF1